MLSEANIIAGVEFNRNKVNAFKKLWVCEEY